MIERLESIKVKLYDGFFVLMVPNVETFDCWLMHEEYGKADFMFGLYKTLPLALLVDIVKANAPEYIKHFELED